MGRPATSVIADLEVGVGEVDDLADVGLRGLGLAARDDGVDDERHEEHGKDYEQDSAHGLSLERRASPRCETPYGA